MKSQICDNVALYAQKYDEEFSPQLPAFVTAIWNLLLSTGLEVKYDAVSVPFNEDFKTSCFIKQIKIFVKCFRGFRGKVDSNDDLGNLQSLMIPLYFISLKYYDYMQGVCFTVYHIFGNIRQYFFSPAHGY